MPEHELLCGEIWSSSYFVSK